MKLPSTVKLHAKFQKNRFIGYRITIENMEKNFPPQKSSALKALEYEFSIDYEVVDEIREKIGLLSV